MDLQRLEERRHYATNLGTASMSTNSAEIIALTAFCVNALMWYWLSRSAMSSLVVWIYLPFRNQSR